MKEIDLSKLNEAQLKPVIDTDGQLLVVAGAGSGKTRVLTHRIARLLSMGVTPYSILAITFTNKAAGEMKSRICRMLGEDNDVWVSTFHSMANRILRADIDKIGYGNNFSIYAESDVERVLKRVLQNKKIDDTKLVGRTRWHISASKNNDETITEYCNKTCFSRSEESVPDIMAAYETEMRQSNALDFDDLLVKCAELFKRSPETLLKYARRFQYIHIDEFQDTNKIQYDLLKQLASYYKNIFAVGDDDQSIYSFRGADVSNMLNFRKDYPGAKVYKLERNYRSTDSILSVANSVISNNSKRIGKNLWTDIGDGERVTVKECQNDRDEAEYVIARISAFLKNGRSLNDIAILVRQNALTRLFEEKLNMYGYKYRLFGGFRFYERKEIRDIISYMKMISNPMDTEAILRIINVPKRGIGEAVVSKIISYATEYGMSFLDVILNVDGIADIGGAVKNKLIEFKNIVIRLKKASELPLFEYVSQLLVISGIEAYYKSTTGEESERYENVDQFINAVREFAKDNPGATVDKYLQSVSLESGLDESDGKDAVTLATIHSVKGLEFGVVFICCLEEEIFPSKRSAGEDPETQEERRVMYVAITRAKEMLFATFAKSRFRFNEIVNSERSRFIKEMEGLGCVTVERIAKPQQASFRPFGKQAGATLNPEREAVEKFLATRKTYSNDTAQKSDASSERLEKYKPGVKVTHNRFGEGTVLATSGYGKEKTADISFKGLGIKKFNLSLAPLTIVTTD